MAAGINLGDNTFAALITRGLNELTRLGVELRMKTRNILWIEWIRRLDCDLFKRTQ